jgi:hypothetical protein
MSLNEVNNLIQNPAAFQKKKSSNAWRWFGAFLLIGLSAFGIFYAYNNNSTREIETQITASSNNSSLSSENTLKLSEPVSDNANKTAGVVEKNEVKNASTDNKLSEKSVESESTTSNTPEKIVSAPIKNEGGTGSMTKHYAGDVNLNFSSDNKKIKMIVSPDNEIGELKIDDQLIAAENYKDYKNIIDEGLKLKNQQFKNDGAAGSGEQSLSAAKRDVMNAMMKQLTSDGLISSDKPFDFTLTGTEIFLNNEKQPAETFEKYKGVYENVTGEKLPSKYNLHIKR